MNRWIFGLIVCASNLVAPGLASPTLGRWASLDEPAAGNL